MQNTRVYFYNDFYWKALLGTAILGALTACSGFDVTTNSDSSAQESACYQHPDAFCVMRLARASALAIEKTDTRTSALEKIAEDQAKMGDFKQAVETACAMDKPNDRVRMLLAIADAQAKARDAEGVQATLKQVLDTAEATDKKRNHFLSLPVRQLAEAQAEAGNFKLALNTAQSISEAENRAYALRGIAIAQAKAGDKEGAQETLKQALAVAHSMNEGDSCNRSLYGTDDCTHTLSWIAAAQAEMGNFQQALDSADAIKDADSRAGALWRIAVFQIKVGDKNGAQTTLKQAVDVAKTIDAKYGSVRDNALRILAEAQAEAGDFQQVLDTVRTISEASWRADVLRMLAEAQAEAGNFKNALSTAGMINEANTRVYALRVIVIAQVNAGDRKGAQAAFEQALDAVLALGASDTTSFLGDVAGAQAKTGDRKEAQAMFQQALNVARTIEAADKRAEALLRIAVTQFDVKDSEGARATFRQAAEAARSLYLLEAIAEAQAKAGNLEQALDTIRTIQDIEARIRAFWHLAAATQVNARDSVKQILDAARATDDASGRTYSSYSLFRIADMQAKAGDLEGARTTFGQALAAARMVEAASDRAYAFKSIAVTLADQRKP